MPEPRPPRYELARSLAVTGLALVLATTITMTWNGAGLAAAVTYSVGGLGAGVGVYLYDRRRYRPRPGYLAEAIAAGSVTYTDDLPETLRHLGPIRLDVPREHTIEATYEDVSPELHELLTGLTIEEAMDLIAERLPDVQVERGPIVYPRLPDPEPIGDAAGLLDLTHDDETRYPDLAHAPQAVVNQAMLRAALDEARARGEL